VKLVCCALHGRSLEDGDSNLYQEPYLKCGFPFGLVSNDHNALKLKEDEQNHWCSL
jgi:hypothetical protein